MSSLDARDLFHEGRVVDRQFVVAKVEEGRHRRPTRITGDRLSSPQSRWRRREVGSKHP